MCVGRLRSTARNLGECITLPETLHPWQDPIELFVETLSPKS